MTRTFSPRAAGKVAAVACMLGGISSPSLHAQAANDDSGTQLVGLTLPIGARVIGQGRAVVADRGELQGLPYNPAVVFGLGGLSYSRFEAADEAEVSGNYLAGSFDSRYGTFAVSAVYLDYGEIVVTDASPQPIGTIDLSEWAIGLTYANRWREWLAYGATAKWYRANFGVAEGSGPAFDAGVVFTPRTDLPLSLAASVRNVGPALDFETSGTGSNDLPADGDREESLPGRVRVGVALHPETFLGLPPDYSLQVLFDIESDLEELATSSQHAGISMLLYDVVSLRGGFLMADNPFVESGDDDRQLGGAFGIGIQHQGFRADVAREVSVSALGDETHFAVSYLF